MAQVGGEIFVDWFVKKLNLLKFNWQSLASLRQNGQDRCFQA